jgi:hypothetical protein
MRAERCQASVYLGGGGQTEEERRDRVNYPFEKVLKLSFCALLILIRLGRNGRHGSILRVRMEQGIRL